MSWGDFLHHKLSQRGDAFVRAVLAQAVAGKALKRERILAQPEHDADEVARMLNGAADDLITVLGRKQVLWKGILKQSIFIATQLSQLGWLFSQVAFSLTG